VTNLFKIVCENANTQALDGVGRFAKEMKKTMLKRMESTHVLHRERGSLVCARLLFHCMHFEKGKNRQALHAL
jgi:hypothetical protein